jgi:hypothetical protein
MDLRPSTRDTAAQMVRKLNIGERISYRLSGREAAYRGFLRETTARLLDWTLAPILFAETKPSLARSARAYRGHQLTGASPEARYFLSI